jgi:outer membrane protein TolC
MRKNLRRMGWAVVPVLAVSLAACRNYNVKYAPFSPRQLQEDERSATGPGISRPDRPLPTTLEVEFPLQTVNNNGGAGGGGATRRGASTRPEVPPATGPAIGASGERVVQMALRELVQRAVANNLEVKVAGYTPAIEQTRVTEAEARFDPTFFTNVQYSQENVLGPSASNISADTDQTTFRTYSAQIGLRQDLESGGRVEVRYEPAHTERVPALNQIGQPLLSVNPFWTSEITLQVTQPLLRDYGADVNRARIVINRNNQRVGLLEYRTELERNIFELERTHWQLVQAMRDVKIADELLDRTIKTGDVIHKRMQHEAGRQQLSQANSSIETRRTILIRARARVRDLSDQLKRLMNDPEFPVASNILILPADEPLGEEVQFNEQDQINTALENRSELGQQQLRVDNAGVAADVAKNNLLPQLNLVGAVGFQGLGEDYPDAVEEQWDFNAIDYTIGLQLEIPIGNRAARAIWKRSQLQRLQAIDQYRALVDEVALNVRTALRQVQTTYDEIYGSRRARLASADALSAIEERERADAAGLSPEFVNRKLDLQAELAQNESREAEAMSNYMIAISDLERAKGTLLRYNNIIMEEAALDANEARANR